MHPTAGDADAVLGRRRAERPTAELTAMTMP